MADQKYDIEGYQIEHNGRIVQLKDATLEQLQQFAVVAIDALEDIEEALQSGHTSIRKFRSGVR